jgi:hypothetical protein
MAALAAVFVFGALLNAFAMVSPVYALESWLAAAMGVGHEAPVLAVMFAVALVVEPVALLGLAGWLSRRAAARGERLLPLTARYAHALAPLGFGVWLAHYGFHFFTGLWTFVPVVQSALAPLAGAPRWDLVGVPPSLVYPAEVGFIGLGLAGSLLVAYRISEELAPARRWAAFAPWAALCLLLGASAIWLLAQPMEMRGTVLGG